MNTNIAILEEFFEDPLLALLAQLNQIEVTLDELPIMLPVEHGRISSRFGMRRHPLSQRLQAHKGIDIIASGSQRKVLATHAGVVEFAGYDGGFGNVVKIRDENTIATLYAHLSEMTVRPGDIVHQGMVIGNIGNTGISTSPHLHYEIMYRGREMDPLRFTGLRNVR
jgi:murein DD-endopeptidase MepM/ murein hydrolase activator NlpD